MGSINQLSKMFHTCFAPGLICTNSLPLQKEPCLQCDPDGPLNAFLAVGRRWCSELQAAAFSSAPLPGFQSSRPGRRCRAEAGAGSQVEQCMGRKSGSCPLGGGGSQAHGAVPGGLEFSWFLKGPVCRQPLTFFSPLWTVHDRAQTEL